MIGLTKTPAWRTSRARKTGSFETDHAQSTEAITYPAGEDVTETRLITAMEEKVLGLFQSLRYPCPRLLVAQQNPMAALVAHGSAPAVQIERTRTRLDYVDRLTRAQQKQYAPLAGSRSNGSDQ
jgi:hypothetical protein